MAESCGGTVIKLKLLIADKHEIFREGLARLLEDEPSIDVVCVCCQGWEAAAHEHQPVSTLGAGARAYISKDTSLENLIKFITLVAEGEVIISSPMATRLLDKFNSLKGRKEIVKTRDDIILSKREQAVLSLVAQGLTNREISTTLYISEHTVKVHLRNIMEKLHAHTRQQAVVLAERKDLLSKVTETKTKTI